MLSFKAKPKAGGKPFEQFLKRALRVVGCRKWSPIKKRVLLAMKRLPDNVEEDIMRGIFKELQRERERERQHICCRSHI